MTWTGAISDAARSAGSRLLDSLLPPQCISCEAPVDTQGMLCPDCWSGVRFIDRPFCAACVTPFEFDQGDDALCGAWIAEPPAYDRARSVMVYDARSRDLILRFKHADRTDGAPTFAKWMARSGHDLVGDADLVVPVPLHRAGLLKRRYNQAALLSNAIADFSDLTGNPHCCRGFATPHPREGAVARPAFLTCRGRFRCAKSSALWSRGGRCCWWMM